MEKNNKKIEMAERIASFVDIADIALDEMHAVIHSHDESVKSSEMEFGFRGTGEIDCHKPELIAKTEFFCRGVSAELDADPWIEITASYRIIYHLKDDPSASDDELKAFSEINGIFNTWPFWREFVYSMLARMGVKPIVMPTLRLEDLASRSTDDSPTE